MIFPPTICEGNTLTITRNTVGRITTIGTSIRVLNPAPAGGYSTSLVFTIVIPAPLLGG